MMLYDNEVPKPIRCHGYEHSSKKLSHTNMSAEYMFMGPREEFDWDVYRMKKPMKEKEDRV